MNRYTVEPYTVDTYEGGTVVRYVIRTPNGILLHTQLGSVQRYRHRSSAYRKARQLSEAYGF